jgi:hypothetical protein
MSGDSKQGSIATHLCLREIPEQALPEIEGRHRQDSAVDAPETRWQKRNGAE